MLLPKAVPDLEERDRDHKIGSEAPMTGKMLSCSWMHLNHAD